MSADDGRNIPAFPTFQHERVYRDGADRIGHEDIVPVGGMDLRDYFAGQALAGMEIQSVVAGPAAQYMVTSAYLIADAMLAERAK